MSDANKIDVQEVIERLGLKAVTAPRYVEVDVWAGAFIGNVIKDALAFRDATGLDVHFTFNDKVIKIYKNTTFEDACEQYDRR